MILLVKDRAGGREVITGVERIEMVSRNSRGSRSVVDVVRHDGSRVGHIDLNDAEVAILPDDPDGRRMPDNRLTEAEEP